MESKFIITGINDFYDKEFIGYELLLEDCNKKELSSKVIIPIKTSNLAINSSIKLKLWVKENSIFIKKPRDLCIGQVIVNYPSYKCFIEHENLHYNKYRLVYLLENSNYRLEFVIRLEFTLEYPMHILSREDLKNTIIIKK
jgi:hypothetical protein